jgi:hypothetical protein
MSKTSKPRVGATAVEDVRKVREKIALQHRGDMREHVKESHRIAHSLRAKLGLRQVPASPRRRRATS